ncbi:hypothetical protein SAMN05878503_1339, partial [Cereibacter ovatus]
MNSSLRLRGLEDRVGCILHQFVQLTVRVPARQNFVLGLEMLGRVSRLSFVGPNRVLKKSPSRNSFLSAQPAGFGFGSIDAGELH